MSIFSENSKRWGLLALATTLGACATSPVPESNLSYSSPVPNHFAESVEQGQDSVAGWKSIGDPVLDGLIQQGLQSNLALAQAVERIEQARALVRGAAGQHWPSTNMTMAIPSQQLARVDAPVLSDAERRVDRALLQASVSWEVDLAGRLRHRLTAQQLRLDARHADAAAVRLRVTAEIADAWYTLEGIRARIAINQAVLDNRESAVRLVRASVSSGAAPSIDEARAKAELAQVRSELPYWQAAQRVQANRLAVLLGELPSGYEPPASQQAPIRIMPLRLPTVVEWIRQRPDLQAARHEWAAFHSDIQALEAELMPRIEITGVLGFVAGSLGGLGSGGSLAWALAPSISLPLFNRERLLADADASRSRGREAALFYQERLLTGLAEVESAMAAYRLGQQTLMELEERLTHAERANKLAERRWRSGAAEMLEWLDAQRQAYQASLAAADAVTLQRHRAVQLLKALGQQPEA